MTVHSSALISPTTRRKIFGAAALVFMAIALLRASLGDVPSTIFFGLFALVAFTLRWLGGKRWFEMLGE